VDVPILGRRATVWQVVGRTGTTVTALGA